TGRLGGLPEEGVSVGTRKHVACSEDRTERYLGAASKGLRGSFRLNLRDTWRVPKEGPKGLVRRRVERGFRRNGFGLASGTGGTLRRTVRQGFRRNFERGHSAELREGFERVQNRGRVFRGQAARSEGGALK